MLVIPTYVERSSIDGLGLFAGQDIEEGDVIWFYDPSTDLVFDKQTFNQIIELLPKDVSERITRWSYTRKGTIVLPADNAKFVNHSNHPNIICNGKYDLAVRKILKDEEITNDYKQFEEDPNQAEKEAYEKIGEEVGEAVGETQSPL